VEEVERQRCWQGVGGGKGGGLEISILTLHYVL